MLDIAERMALYRRDLDVVAVAPTGEIASFCAIWYNDATRNALFEPVGMTPERQRRGGRSEYWTGDSLCD